MTEGDGDLLCACRFLTMEELLHKLIQRSRKDCEEAHRQMIFAMNGQAGIFMIQDTPRVAVNFYYVRFSLAYAVRLDSDPLGKLP